MNPCIEHINKQKKYAEKWNFIKIAHLFMKTDVKPLLQGMKTMCKRYGLFSRFIRT